MKFQIWIHNSQVNNKPLKIIQIRTQKNHKILRTNGKVKAKGRMTLLWKIRSNHLEANLLSFSEGGQILRTSPWLSKVKSTKSKELGGVLLKDPCEVMPSEREALLKKLLNRRSLNWLKKRWRLSGKFSNQDMRIFSWMKIQLDINILNHSLLLICIWNPLFKIFNKFFWKKTHNFKSMKLENVLNLLLQMESSWKLFQWPRLI